MGKRFRWGAWLTALLAVVLSLSLLAGCGESAAADTPDGALKSILNAVKNGDYQAMQELSGASSGSDLEDAAEMKAAGELLAVFFQNVDVQVSLKEADESSATVLVQGKTSDLSALDEEISTELEQEVSAWALENMDRLLKLSNEEMQRESIRIMKPILKKYVAALPQKEIQAEIIMTKNSDGRWEVAESSSADMLQILFGTSDAVDIGKLLTAA